MTSLLDGFKALGPARLAAMALVALGMFGLLAVLALHGGGNDHMALLYADLDPREAGQITEQLDKQHIAYQVNTAGSQVLVPGGDVARARMLLAKDGLPSGGSIGYEIFDRGDALTANQFQQNLNQARALEGELARTIRTINGVRGARVHLVMPKREPFERERQPAQASVLLTMAGSGRLDREGVQAIVTLISAAVPGLRAHNIAIVDSRGNLLARAGEVTGASAAAAEAEGLRRTTEMRLSRAVEEMLERSLGAGRVHAEAAVDMDFDQSHETLEKFDPDGQVVRSSQNVTNNSKSTEQNSNVSVQNNLPNADAGTNPVGSQEQRQEETTNYEIGKTVRTLVHDQPQIRRISVAVMVDGSEERGADGKPVWKERAADDIERIGRLVRTAIGFDEKRGDKVEVVSMRFAAPVEDAVEAPRGFLGVALEKQDLLGLGRTVLLGLFGLVALLFVLRPMVLRLTTAPAGQLGDASAGVLFGADGLVVPGSQGTHAGAIGAGGMGAGGGVGPDGQLLLTGPGGGRHPGTALMLSDGSDGGLSGDESLVDMANVEGKLRASSIRRLTELVEKHPEESLTIVRAWMQQEAA